MNETDYKFAQQKDYKAKDEKIQIHQLHTDFNFINTNSVKKSK